jgi:hypothetical protein
MGNIGSHVDLTSGRSRTSSELNFFYACGGFLRLAAMTVHRRETADLFWLGGRFQRYRPVRRRRFAVSATLNANMSALNGDKARFHRERKAKLARRERSQTLRKTLSQKSGKRPRGRDA